MARCIVASCSNLETKIMLQLKYRNSSVGSFLDTACSIRKVSLIDSFDNFRVADFKAKKNARIAITIIATAKVIMKVLLLKH